MMLVGEWDREPDRPGLNAGTPTGDGIQLSERRLGLSSHGEVVSDHKRISSALISHSFIW